MAWGPGSVTGRLLTWGSAAQWGLEGGLNLFRRSPLIPCTHICGLLASPGGRLALWMAPEAVSTTWVCQAVGLLHPTSDTCSCQGDETHRGQLCGGAEVTQAEALVWVGVPGKWPQSDTQGPGCDKAPRPQVAVTSLGSHRTGERGVLTPRLTLPDGQSAVDSCPSLQGAEPPREKQPVASGL